MTTTTPATRTDDERWLQRYYFLRAAVGAIWAAAAFTVGQQSAVVGAALLIAYPAWDAAANYVDAARHGGLGRNRTQTVNLAISVVATIAVAAGLLMGPGWVLTVFGGWAVLSGLLQLATAVRRWRSSGAQWAMVLSGGQSAVVGILFMVQAHAENPSAISTAAGYASMGAFYFLVSAVWLTVKRLRRNTTD
jgi:uncharacterized membrane protein HdeD (DUF308 family)